MIPKEVADVADFLAAEFGGAIDDYITVAYRIVNIMKKAAASEG